MTVQMVPVPELAKELQEIARLCDIPVSLRRCEYVISCHKEVTDSLSMRAVAPTLITEAASLTSLSVAGVQEKYWADGMLYKLDDCGMCQGCKEHIISKALDCVTVNGIMVPHVEYAACRIRDTVGCRCSSYRKPGEIEVNLGNIDNVSTLSALSANSTLKPVLRDIAITFLCDALFYNEDRHAGNIIFLFGDTVRLAPIFDMGNALSFNGAPNYEHYEPEPYLLDQVEWARRFLGDSVVRFDCIKFYNHFNREELPYPKTVVDALLERVLACAESGFVRSIMEVG